MIRWRRPEYHTPGLLRRLLERLRGREQKLVRAAGEGPILLLSFPTGAAAVAEEVEAAYIHTLPSVSPATLGPYVRTLGRLPVLVVVLLRPLNPCGCLGHHHPRGAESRLARRLIADLGSPVGEIDLAWEAIRRWQPRPLASLAAVGFEDRLAEVHFSAALLAVLLHELDHVAFPDKPEREIRANSNQFYSALMDDLVLNEYGRRYGMAAPSPPS